MLNDPPRNHAPRTLLCFDYGTHSIGVAAGQRITGTASPLPEVPTRRGSPDWAAIEELVAQWRPDAFVVGMPYNMDGSASDIGEQARAFAEQLTARFALPCYPMDERLSTREARDISRDNAERRGARFNQRRRVDSLAAQLILETWLAENA